MDSEGFQSENKPAKSQYQVSNTRHIDIAIPTFGYKDHLSIDKGHGLIGEWAVTDAACYDGDELENLINPDNIASEIRVDTAYGSRANHQMSARRELKAHIHTHKPEKAHERNRPQKPTNTR